MDATTGTPEMTLAGPYSTVKRMEFSHATRKGGLARSKGHCERCGSPFSPSNRPEFHHITEAAEGGKATLDNCQVLGAKCCHRKETREYVARKSKANRQSNEGHWLKETKASMPGSKGSKWRKRMNGIVELRETDYDS